MHAFLTVTDTNIGFRLENDATGREPIGRPHVTAQEREAALGRVMEVLIGNGVTSVEIRYDDALGRRLAQR